MRNLICLLALVFGVNSFAASGSGNISNVVTLGGVNSSDSLNIQEANSQGYFTIYTPGLTSSGVAQRLIKNGVQYQVTAGKTFQAVKICAASFSVSKSLQLLSATASFADQATLASLTGPVYQSGASTGFSLITSTTALTFQCYSTTYSFGASTYAGVTGNDNSAMYVFVVGKEI